MEVGGYIGFTELILQGAPNEAIYPLHGEVSAEQERLCVSGVQASLNHRLRKPLYKRVCNCSRHSDD